MPWAFKIIYGLLSDNVPILGSKRRSYIMIMGIVQFISLISIYALNENTANGVAFLLMVASISESFVNVVADAIMCI